MSVTEIQVLFKKGQTHVTQTIELEGIRVDITTFTNKFDGSWYWSMSDADGDFIFEGNALAVGLQLTYRYKYNAGLPPGIFMVFDQTGTPYVDPGLDSFENDDAALFYVSSDETFVAPDPVALPDPVTPPVEA